MKNIALTCFHLRSIDVQVEAVLALIAEMWKELFQVLETALGHTLESLHFVGDVG